MASKQPDDDGWTGRFARNDIISLLDVDRPFNLAESTSRDLRFGEVMDLVGETDLRALSLGYGSSAGLPALREAVAATCGVSDAEVVTTTGAALALFLLAFELCRPGDEAVLVTPCFPPSRDVLRACDVTVREIQLSFDDGYQIDVERISAVLSPRTRLVSVASPQNPSGVSTSLERLAAVRDIMAARSPEAFLFVDETYREAAYGEASIAPSAAILGPRVLVGASISKSYGAPGLRTGWLIVADERLRERLLVAKMNMIISGSSLDEMLAAGLLRRHVDVLGPRRKALAKALDVLGAWHESERGRLDWVRPDAGALCCFRLRQTRFDAAAISRFWASLPSLDLQLASGAWFGETDRVFRLGFGFTALDVLERGLSALSVALDRAERA